MNMGILHYYFSMKALLWVLAVFVQTHEYMGCFEEERVGLLHLKSFLIISVQPHTYSNYLLPSWVDHEKSDCCGWEQVTCNSTTGHVIELSLNNLMQDPHCDDPYYFQDERLKYEEPWLLNVSLLEPFKELRSLDLSCNAMDGCIPDEGFEKLSTLRNLEILNLGYNFFDDNSILQSLGAITSLKTLNLTGNKLEGYFPAQELVTLRNLNTLDISYNQYIGTLPNQGFERLAVLRNLETLILNSNSFDVNIIPSLGNLTSLVRLSLAENDWVNERVKAVDQETVTSFKKTKLQMREIKPTDLRKKRRDRPHPHLQLIYGPGMSCQGWKMLPRLKNLEILDLSFNALNDTSFLQSIAGLKSLKKLNLAFNRLTGSFGTKGWKMLSRLKNLEILYLGGNLLNDTSFLQSIAAIRSLKNLNLADNSFTGSFGTKDLTNFSKLEILDISGNLFTGSVSPSIWELFSLKALSLSYNLFNDTLPTQEFCTLKKLEELDLSHNGFEGILPPCINNMTSLRFLDVSENHFK